MKNFIIILFALGFIGCDRFEPPPGTYPQRCELPDWYLGEEMAIVCDFLEHLAEEGYELEYR